MQRRTFLTALGAFATATTLAACGGSTQSGSSGASSAVGLRTVDEIKSAGTIIIGVFSDKSPFGYVDSSGDYAGYDIEYGNRIAQDLGVEVKYVPVEAASRVEFLQTGKVDLILANFTVTPERAEKVDFANPYMKVSLGVVAKQDLAITKIEDLADKKVIVVKGTTAETYFEDNHPEVKLQKYDQYTEATNALADGRGDAWATDNTEALAWAPNNPGFTVGITSLGAVDTIAGAVRKGNTTLLEWLNEELVELGNEQFFHAAYDKTLRLVYGDAVPADELVVEGGVVA